MNFILATHKGLYITDESGISAEISQGYYYSTVFLPQDRAILSVRRVNPWTKDSRAVGEIFDLSGRRLFGPGPDLTEVRDPHQGLFTDDGLYLTNAHEDRIHFFDFGPRKRTGEWTFEEEDTVAPNSITRNPEGFLVGFHNRSRRPSSAVWLDEDMEIRRKVDLPDEGIHNLLEDEDGRLIYNASEVGEIVRWDPEDGVRESLDPGPNLHTKGMARIGRILVTGASDSEVTLDQRFLSRSWLIFTDLDQWTIRKRVPLLLNETENIANLNEIVGIDV